MDPLIILAVAVAAAVGGVVVGFLVRSLWASQTMKAATSEARRIEAEARARQKELILEAKDEARMQREAEEEARAFFESVWPREPAPPATTARSAHRHARAARPLLDRERELTRRGPRPRPRRTGRPERVANMNAEEARNILIEAVRRGRAHAVKIARLSACPRGFSRTRRATSSSPPSSAWPRPTPPSTPSGRIAVGRNEGPHIGREGRNIRLNRRPDRPDHRRHARDRDPVGLDPVRREIARWPSPSSSPTASTRPHQEVA
jgi:hypothetical protein